MTLQNVPFVVADLPGHRLMKLLPKCQGTVQHKNVTNPLVFQGIPASAVPVGDSWPLPAGKKPLQNQWILKNFQVRTLCVQHVMCENYKNSCVFKQLCDQRLLACEMRLHECRVAAQGDTQKRKHKLILPTWRLAMRDWHVQSVVCQRLRTTRWQEITAEPMDFE